MRGGEHSMSEKSAVGRREALRSDMSEAERRACSLCSIAADDIAPPPPKESIFSKNRRPALLRRIVTVGSSLVFAVCLVLLIYVLRPLSGAARIR